MGNCACKDHEEKEATKNRLERTLQELDTTKSNLAETEKQRQRDFEQMQRYKAENEATKRKLERKLESVLRDLETSKSHFVKTNEQRQRDFELRENTIMKYKVENEHTQKQLESVLHELDKTKSVLKLKEYEVRQLESKIIQANEAKLVKTNEQRQKAFEQIESTVKKYKVENEDTQNKLRSVLQDLEKTKSLLKSKEYELNQLKLPMLQTTKAPVPRDNVFQNQNSIFNKTQSRSLIDAEKRIEELEREIKEIGEENKQLKRENEKIENEQKKQATISDTLALEHGKTIAEFKRTSGTGSDKMLSNENLRLKDELRRLQIENKEQKSEIDQWKLRLSKVAGERLVTGNTAITDLGDKYRPQKLSDMFVSLYDDKWTDAFEVIKGNDDNEQHACNKLLKIVQDCWEFCLQYSKNQLEALQLSFINADIKDENRKREILDNYPSQLTKVIKDTRRCFALEFLPSLQQLYWKQDKTNMSESLWPFVKACIEICWHSAISDPALHYMFTADNLENFKPYTRSGSDVDYVVWPAMHLHKFGPLLSKGVVQFKKMTTKVQ